MKLARFLRLYGNLLRLHADQFTTAGRVGLTGNLQFRSDTLSLRSAMASNVDCFIKCCLIARGDTVSHRCCQRLVSFLFNCENRPESDKAKVGPIS